MICGIKTLALCHTEAYLARIAPKKAAEHITMYARSIRHTGQRLMRSTRNLTWSVKRIHVHLNVRGIYHHLQSHGHINTGVDMAELLIFLLGIFVGASLGVFLMALVIASRDDEDIR